MNLHINLTNHLDVRKGEGGRGVEGVGDGGEE